MKNYVSMGMGVNSVAMMLMMLDQKTKFEAIFVNHGADYPETYEYFNMFQKWLVEHGHKPITELKPEVQGTQDLYEHCWKYEIIPSFMRRWCTDKFKITPMKKYIEKPCFQNIGIDAGEAKRARIATDKGVENRYPLIEAGVTREGCKDIIKAHGLPVPIKSGCYICPFQKVYHWQELRRNHPELFCKAEKLEKRNMEYRKRKGKKPLFLNQYPKARLSAVVDEKQMRLTKEDEYPPCMCEL